MLLIQALHGLLAHANWPLYFRVDNNTDGELVPLWFNGKQFADEHMKPAKWQALLRQNPVCNEETSRHHHHHDKHRANIYFQHLLQATKEMNPTLTILLTKLKVVTVTMKCTLDYPRHQDLNSLHDMAHYKKRVVNCALNAYLL